MIEKKRLSFILLVFSLILLNNFIVSALSCDAFKPCPGMGTTQCYTEDGHYVMKKYNCEEGQCKQIITDVVDCCSPNLGCPTDQFCQDGKCAGGNVNIPIDPMEKFSDNTNTSPSSSWVIGISIIIGFIIFAIIIRKKN